MFYRLLYTGSAELEESSVRSERYILSSAEDDLYKVTNGKIKPAKQILGMGIKSLTGSRKVQEIINHFGHCVGYHCTEEIETELAENILQGDRFLPDGLNAIPEVSTGLAWDNFDENKDSLSGLGTLHDTQGICFQNSAHGCQEHPRNPSEEYSRTKMRSKKRSLEVSHCELEPLRKKPALKSFHFEVQTM